MELLKQLEDFTPQGFVGGNGGGSQAHGDVLTVHGDVCRGVIEDGEELEDMQEEEAEKSWPFNVVRTRWLERMTAS